MIESAWFVNEDNPSERLGFQTMPVSLEFTRTPGVATISNVGNNIPNYQFTGGESSLSFSISFFSDSEDGLDVLRKIKWLEAFTFADDITFKLPRLIILFGDVFTFESWTITSFAYRLEIFDGVKNLLPTYGAVDITLALDVLNRPTRRDIAR